MSKKFNVLATDLDLSHHYLIEASAGTGKTFSIENIILRLIVEGDEALGLDQILAVTFTRAAVADMKRRVRENLQRILYLCKQHLQGKTLSGIPDFLNPHFDRGAESVRQLKRRLERALATFDQACIYTIHSFCARMLRENMLEGNIFIDASAGEKDLAKSKLQEIVKDYLRTELTNDVISSSQLNIAIKEYKDIDNLVRALANAVASIMPIEAAPAFKNLFGRCVEGMRAIQARYHIQAERLLEDFVTLAPHYKDVCNVKKEIHASILSTAQKFVAIFEKPSLDCADFNFLIENNGFWNETLCHKKTKFPLLTLNYPGFTEEFLSEVSLHAAQAADPERIFSILAAGCQKMGQRILEETDQIGFNSLLKAMLEACQNPTFAANVRARFKAVVIDEFQDTDPLQWEIFRLLFPLNNHDWGRIFLVGDPKQSIYSFRQADIYTYLSASQELDGRSKAHLDCNYRSEPALINALNCLFEAAFAPNFIQLPLLNSCIEYLPVKAGKTDDYDFKDGIGSLHALLIEKKRYNFEEIDKQVFPYIADEIQRLTVNNHFKLSKFAVLVADKYQGDRLIDYLRTWNIAAVYQKAPSLKESIAIRALRELLTALINPKDESALKIALGGPVIGWTHEQVRLLDNPRDLEEILIMFYKWRTKLWTEGFAAFFEEFMQSEDADGKTMTQKFLEQIDAPVFYNEWMHLADVLIEKHSHNKISPEKLIDDLLEIEESENDSADLNIQTVADENAVQVLTIHSSKGLEFDIVFAIGLYKRSKKPCGLIPIPLSAGGYVQKAVDVGSEVYEQHCEEIDAEKMRQLYVAMTRAKHRLYVPFLFAKTEASYLASPCELFAARCGQLIQTYPELYQQIAGNKASAFEEKLKSLQARAKVTFSTPCPEQVSPKPLMIHSKPLINPPPRFEPSGQALFLKSYTLLAKPSGHEGGGAPTNFTAEEKTAHTLPAGSEVGILLHSLLEKVAFSDVRYLQKPAELLTFVRTFTEASGFRAWDHVIADITYAALKTPLFEGVPPLAEISPNECYREMEFMFPATEGYGFDGYLKGVIDLIFRHEGKFYLVDWKSNWLGPHQEAYSDNNMGKAMEENDYLLQARIYREAVRRYLNLIGEDAFGGIAYVFLRGITSSTGIYNIKTIEE